MFIFNFSVTSSLALTGKLHSIDLVKQIKEILERNNIKYILRIYKDYGRFYINKEGAIKIINDWRLNNPKHISKYNVYKKFKRYFPFSTTSERLSLLNKEISIKELENLCKNRSRRRGRNPRFPFT